MLNFTIELNQFFNSTKNHDIEFHFTNIEVTRFRKEIFEEVDTFCKITY